MIHPSIFCEINIPIKMTCVRISPSCHNKEACCRVRQGTIPMGFTPVPDFQSNKNLIFSFFFLGGGGISPIFVFGQNFF